MDSGFPWRLEGSPWPARTCVLISYRCAERIHICQLLTVSTRLSPLRRMYHLKSSRQESLPITDTAGSGLRGWTGSAALPAVPTPDQTMSDAITAFRFVCASMRHPQSQNGGGEYSDRKTDCRDCAYCTAATAPPASFRRLTCAAPAA